MPNQESKREMVRCSLLSLQPASVVRGMEKVEGVKAEEPIKNIEIHRGSLPM